MIKAYLVSMLIAFVLSFLGCVVAIPLLKKLKAGQNILHYVKEHKSKSGTPTMGGIAFVFATLATALLFYKTINRTLLVAVSVGLAYMCVGLIDDFLKLKHRQNLGLRAWQKFAFQFVIAIFVGIYCVNNKLGWLYIPFTKMRLNIGFWILPLSVFVFLGTVNAVNLTDGLDGLAAGVGIPFIATMGALIAIQGGDKGLSLLSFSLAGSLVAYLLFNVFPARVFMGDTGSLSLGGFAASIGLLSGNALYIAVIGGCFVFSVISVLIQVIYYKATKGKRVFLMAPAHHHFQKKGHSECRISYAYFVITCTIGIICIIMVL